MKRITLTICAALFLFACNNEKKGDEKQTDKESTSTEIKKEDAWIPYDTAAENKAWMESITLGEPHKMLAKGAGTWNADVTMWMGDGEPSMNSKSTAVNTMLFGGLFQQSKHSGTMMGMPFEGISLIGYDNVKKEFTSTWIDNFGSGIFVSTGKWDESTKTLNLSGQMKNPVNGLNCTLREVFRFVDDNTQVLEMYGPDRKTGKEFKTMEIKYTRKK